MSETCNHTMAILEVQQVNVRLNDRVKMLEATLASLAEIGEQIRTQDNRCTGNPVFIVQQKRREYGYDSQWSDNAVWLSDGDEASPQRAGALEKRYRNSYETEIGGWTRTPYKDHWEFVTACFTKAGCEDYLRLDGHNLKETRIYVASGNRNNEWQAIRAALAALPKEAL